MTTPICHVETGDAFWAQARAECSILGIIVYTGRADQKPRKKCILYISDIIDHTALAEGLQLVDPGRTLQDDEEPHQTEQQT